MRTYPPHVSRSEVPQVSGAQACAAASFFMTTCWRTVPGGRPYYLPAPTTLPLVGMQIWGFTLESKNHRRRSKRRKKESKRRVLDSLWFSGFSSLFCQSGTAQVHHSQHHSTGPLTVCRKVKEQALIHLSAHYRSFKAVNGLRTTVLGELLEEGTVVRPYCMPGG